MTAAISDLGQSDDSAIASEIWEISENIHRLDLPKDQRDEHTQRYAELLEVRQEASRQNGAKPASTSAGSRPHGVAREVAEETGISVRTVHRALNPKPAPEP